MRVELGRLPLEVRAEAAWQLVVDGTHPLDALYAAVWPQGAVFVESQERVERFCRHGHAITRENTYVVPGTGWRRCLTCKRAQQRTRRRTDKRPCQFCGAPATPPYNKKPEFKGIVRCRACYVVGKSAPDVGDIVEV